MVALAQSEALSVSNPRLIFYAADRTGQLSDLDALTWEIFRKVTDGEKVAPVSIASGTTDLVVDRIGRGRYALDYSVDPAAIVGLYEVRWSYTFPALASDGHQPGGHTDIATEEFEILAGTGALRGGPAYAFVAQVREENQVTGVSDARIQTAIILASRLIESVTGRFFEPRYNPERHGGSGSRALMLSEPIIGIDEVSVTTYPDLVPDAEIDRDSLRVFSRHLSMGVQMPDDRENPKISFDHIATLSGTGHFPTGTQNILINGVYGYRDSDGVSGPSVTPWGQVPDLIRYATMLLAARYMPAIKNPCRSDTVSGWRLIEQKVNDQSMRLAPAQKWGSYTGDPEIDQILVSFMRPPEFGSA